MMTVGTAVVIGVNILAAIWEFAWLPSSELRFYTLLPAAILNRGEWYRILSSAYLHAGAMHLGVNMLSTAAVGRALETRWGTWRFLGWVFWSAPLAGATHVCLAWLLSLAGFNEFLRQPSIGFSGVLFALVVSETWRSDARRSLFGMVEVPAKAYPFAMLAAMQIFLPNISFLGHLAGLVVGALEYSGCFFFLPPTKSIATLLDEQVLRRCPPLPPAIAYVSVATAVDTLEVSSSSSSSSSSCGPLLWSALVYAKHFIVFAADFTGISKVFRAIRRRASELRCCCTRGASVVSYHRVGTTAAANDDDNLLEEGGLSGGGKIKNNKPPPPPPVELPMLTTRRSSSGDTVEV